MFYNNKQTEEKILNRINRNKNSYKVNESKVDISMLDEVEPLNSPLDFIFENPRLLLHINQSMIRLHYPLPR